MESAGWGRRGAMVAAAETTADTSRHGRDAAKKAPEYEADGSRVVRGKL